MTNLYIQYGPALLLGAISVLAFLGSRYLLVKIKNTTIQSMVSRFFLELRAVVIEVNQTVVDAMKERNEDGVLTEAERKEVMDIAIKKLKSNLGSQFLLKLTRILGLSSVEDWLTTQAEAMVNRVKQESQPTTKKS